MADYPGTLINSGILISANANTLAYLIESSIVFSANSVIQSTVIGSGNTFFGNGNSNGLLISSELVIGIEAAAKRYFNNGFSQDGTKVYISKQSLGITSLDTSLEALFIGLLKQWVLSLKPNDESRIECELFAYDKVDNYIVFNTEIRFKKLLTTTDDEITNLPTVITPLDY
jgi:hypothetical protein